MAALAFPEGGNHEVERQSGGAQCDPTLPSRVHRREASDLAVLADEKYAAMAQEIR